MNKQNVFNSSDMQNIGSSAQLLYLEIEPSLLEMPAESRTVPLNVFVNSTQDHFLVPVVKSKNDGNQVCVYVDSTREDYSGINYTENQRNHPVIEENTENANLQISQKSMTPNPSSSTSNTSNICNISAKVDECEIDVGSHNYSSRQKTANEGRVAKEKNNIIKGFVPILDRNVPPRAVAVLPESLHFRRDCISPRRSLPDRVRFGPVQGVTHQVSYTEALDIVLNAAKSNMPVFLLHNTNGVTHIDMSDKDKSNWLGLLPLGTSCTANVWLYEEDSHLYGITVGSIEAGTPLAIGYTKPYVQDYGLPEGVPVLEITEDLFEVPRRWWCHECHRSFQRSAQLQRHVDLYHSEDVSTVKRKYRCRHCTCTFMRLFTLKRHMAQHCNKRTVKENSNKAPTADDILNSSLNIDDNRLPSDESLQNYTNVLDFSTNLFDTDRIPGLDISGSSRSEAEFNPYTMTDKEEFNHDLGFDKVRNEIDKPQDLIKEQTKEHSQQLNETMLISCPYCKQTILREKKRQHLSDCTAKRFQCECGRTFPSNEKLEQHVNTEHPDPQCQTKTVSEESNILEYKCEKCQLTFKRRGMLVNHLWRLHGARLAAPLQRRVRHYPCAACPKLYRTAAKRDIHHANHHPGVPAHGRYAIEGGRRSVAAAACGACPRQYATRAKLLQHQRQAHPELAPPLKRPSKKPDSPSQKLPT